ncbi:MAG: prolyl oligopeptidase family serine peptidase [Candidatus Kapaibacterium sp.]
MRLIAITLVAMLAPYLDSVAQLRYPTTKRVDVRDTIHRTIVDDPYRWLENEEDSDVTAWVERQAALADSVLLNISYREVLIDRLDAVNTFERRSAPWHRAGMTFFYRNDGKQNHSVLCMQRDGSSDVEVLLDPNTFSQDGTVALAFASESRDGKYLAFGKSEGGSDWRDIYIMDIASRKLLPEVIRFVKNSGVSWHENGFFYSRYDSSSSASKSLVQRNSQQYVMYHRLGSAQSQDELVYTDPSNPEQFVGCYVLEDSPYLIRTVRKGNQDGNEVYVRPLSESLGAWKRIYASPTASFYPRHDHNGVLYGVSTDGSPNGRVVRMADPLGEASMETVVPERNVVLDELSFGGGRMFLTYMSDVHHVVEVANLNGKKLADVTLPGIGSISGFDGFTTDTAVYYTFTSYTTPTTIYRYDIASGTSSIWQSIKAPFDPSSFSTEQVFVTSKDGARIPMTILRKKGVSGPRPTMLYGYGGFNISITPGFNVNYMPWLEQGCVIAIANLRGGGEYGEEWHKAGMRLNKQNVFDDAIACAEWLISNGVAKREILALNGRSNGGLLVGAVINQRPDLFRVAIPEVGVMDMLRFHRFTIGWNWQADYGEITKPDEFKTLRAYSPYHNLRKGVEYPSTMVMTADHDDRVVPAHSFKYAAMLQHVYSGSRPMLLRVKLRSGHGDVNRRKLLEGVADKYSFMWSEMGFIPTFTR